MEELLSHTVSNQMGAAMDMLQQVITRYPDENWPSSVDFNRLSFHTLFFLDYYLTEVPASFVPPAPFTESEFDDIPPPEVYSKTQLLDYLTYCRVKAAGMIADLDNGKAAKRWINQSGSMNYSFIEILLYNIRHLQHHTAQLIMLLRQRYNIGTEWVFRAIQ